jgi:hypothetical protein
VCDEALAIDRENQSQSSIEDTSLMDHKPLPDIPRITNLKLAGQVYTNLIHLNFPNLPLHPKLIHHG